MFFGSLAGPFVVVYNIFKIGLRNAIGYKPVPHSVIWTLQERQDLCYSALTVAGGSLKGYMYIDLQVRKKFFLTDFENSVSRLP